MFLDLYWFGDKIISFTIFHNNISEPEIVINENKNQIITYHYKCLFFPMIVEYGFKVRDSNEFLWILILKCSSYYYSVELILIISYNSFILSIIFGVEKLICLKREFIYLFIYLIDITLIQNSEEINIYNQKQNKLVVWLNVLMCAIIEKYSKLISYHNITKALNLRCDELS